MKKLITIFSVCMAVIFFTHFSGQATKKTEVTVYFVDRYMHRLVPVVHSIPDASVQKQAEKIIELLYTPTGSSFTQYINLKKGDIRVKLRGETVTVDLSRNILANIPKDRENQQMFIYQIVNSLCTVQGIEYVRFTVNGKQKENYLAFIDFREYFSSNFY